ncbi:hypothetical protein [Flaviflexus massiliensis]|uniref:hypothetical protein n=1 Tax=Flaviflexus massiliensis TaxID=1522309 RepID=UPI0011C84E0F|nr:hypothetical protein [Flaviflexus massiliensis]
MTIGQRLQPGIHEHFVGQSTKETATVTHIEKVNICGRTNKDEYTMTWTEDGIQRTETVKRCGDSWKVGDQVKISSTAGILQTPPRIVLQLTVTVIVVAMATDFTLVLRTRRSVINQAQAILNVTWQPVEIPTAGLPGTGGSPINPQAPLKTRMFYRTPTIIGPRE